MKHGGAVTTIRRSGFWYSLVCDPLQRGIIVEAKVARVDDVISSSLLGEIVKRPQVT
jgi:hypothetical protein